MSLLFFGGLRRQLGRVESRADGNAEMGVVGFRDLAKSYTHSMANPRPMGRPSTSRLRAGLLPSCRTVEQPPATVYRMLQLILDQGGVLLLIDLPTELNALPLVSHQEVHQHRHLSSVRSLLRQRSFTASANCNIRARRPLCSSLFSS